MWGTAPRSETLCCGSALLYGTSTYEGDMKMDHDVVVREQVTEKYLLNELDPEARDQFEQHFFDCQQCAFDIRAASEFLGLTRRVLAEEQDAVRCPRRQTVSV